MLQGPLWVNKLEPIPPQQLRKQLVDLEESEVAADAEVGTAAELSDQAVSGSAARKSEGDPRVT